MILLIKKATMILIKAWVRPKQFNRRKKLKSKRSKPKFKINLQAAFLQNHK